MASDDDQDDLDIVFAPPRSSQQQHRQEEQQQQPAAATGYRSVPSISFATSPNALLLRGSTPGNQPPCPAPVSPTLEACSFIEERHLEVQRRLAALSTVTGGDDGDAVVGVQTTETAADDKTAVPVAAEVEKDPAIVMAFAPPQKMLEERMRISEKIDWEVPQQIINELAQAYDEDPSKVGQNSAHMSRFSLTGVMDAARAAWIGGTKMLNHGELLPSGTAKALEVLVPGFAASAAKGHGINQFALELGMGRGRVATQLFAMGAAVVGVELARERYDLAVTALERLAHRCPDTYEVVFVKREAARIRRVSNHGALFEARHGNFFACVAEEEIRVATLIIMQVCLPPTVWPQLRTFLERCKPGCRILSYEDLELVWRGVGRGRRFPFRDIGNPLLACSWAASEGHRFYCYERLEEEGEDGNQ